MLKSGTFKIQVYSANFIALLLNTELRQGKQAASFERLPPTKVLI